MRPALPILLSAALLAGPASAATSVVVEVDGMVCNGCQKNIAGALDALPFIEDAFASFAVGGACGTLTGALDSERVRAAVEGAGDYTVAAIETREGCPEELRPGGLLDPWHDSGDLDVQIISEGEEVDIQAHLVPDKFTIIDFGAPWCGPCHTSAAALKPYLAEHGDVAVRAITLGGDDPRTSYALPVVEQHLKWVSGIPYFIVYAPDGREVYKGDSAEKLMKVIDKKRGP